MIKAVYMKISKILFAFCFLLRLTGYLKDNEIHTTYNGKVVVTNQTEYTFKSLFLHLNTNIPA